MVFENLTLFEIKLEGAQFGPRSMNRSADAEDAEIEVASAGRPGRLGGFVFMALLVSGLALLYRRSRSTETEFAFDAESDDAEADLAAAQ